MLRILCVAVLGTLAACSPALDWRLVTIPEAGLQASLPCKPDQVQRSVELAGTPVDMHMSGCEADGATFAVACAAVQDPAQTGAALTHWRAAVLAGLQAPAEGHAGAPRNTAFIPTGALNIPPSVRTEVQGRSRDGASVAAQAVWFARVQGPRVQGPRVQACHAIVLSAQPRLAQADQFFAGLVLQ